MTAADADADAVASVDMENERNNHYETYISNCIYTD
jgi:hypothetical protein